MPTPLSDQTKYAVWTYFVGNRDASIHQAADACACTPAEVAAAISLIGSPNWREPIEGPIHAQPYAKLRAVLDAAYAQSATGKGKERHANDRPFDQQPLFDVARMVGLGFPLGQAMKKSQEAAGMAERGATDAARHELLGAIVYLAAAHILLDPTGGE